MVPGPNGYAPQQGYLAQRFNTLLNNTAHAPDITLHEYDELIDSSDLKPQHWNQIGRDIARHYEQYDGFVVIHGTDTMAYTASALSFMLENLAKPVILTGAQIAWHDAGSDAESNLFEALTYAADPTLAGVYIAFGGLLLQGNRARKTETEKLTAFSASAPIQRSYLPRETPLSIQLVDPALDIALGKLAPGATQTMLTHYLQTQPDGLVLESFGSGNGPTTNHALLHAIRAACEAGCQILNVSQCLHGMVTDTYAAGQSLHAAGAIPGRDITPEAALGKLYYVLSKTPDPALQKQLLQQNLRGEIY